MPVIEVEHLSFAYEGGAEVLSDVDLAVEPGELVAIAGPNGGGKTTLVRLMLGLERPASGRVRLFGDPVRPGRGDPRIAYLPQRADSALSAPITVDELVTVGRAPLRGILRVLDRADDVAIRTAIEHVGLAQLASRPLTTLSGGQRQRAFIAKALAAEPELLILDEPSAGVDADAQEALAALVDRLRAELGVTVLYVSHEFGALEPFVERLLIVRGGIAFDGPPASLPAEWHDPSHEHS
jgi:zinc transport system ATP-binding protein